MLALLALVDFLSGIALRARRRAAVAAPAVSRSRARPAETIAAEPQFDPAPAPAPAAPSSPVPAATSVAESVLMDHPEPALAQPAVVTSQASPEVLSPQLQPGAGPSTDASRRG
jgi:hypothetical protein